MPNYTSNLKLEKPLVTDNYDINVSNGNMDKIDLEVKKLQDNKSNNGHTHTKSNITDFAHTHSMGEITGLELSSTKVMRPNQKTVEQSLSDNETSISSLNNKTDTTNNTLNTLKTKVDNGQNHKLTQDTGFSIMKSNTDLNSITKSGLYAIEGSVSNKPNGSTAYFHVEVMSTSDSWCKQVATNYTDGTMFVRVKNNNTWTAWRSL